jgi:peptide/nickel transport system permease protein
MGRLTFDAILSRDYPTIMGTLSVSAFLTLVGLLLSDILYAVVDPRIKYE